MVKDTRDWGKFVAKDLFGPSQLGKYHNPKTLYESDNGYEFICASVMNNGINKSMPKVDGENLSLTPPNIIAWGKQSPFFTYHENPCVTSQGMYFIEVDNLTRNQIHFVITVLNKLTTGYNYTNCLIGKKFDELSVPLPLKPGTDPSNYTEDDIDWSYMESTIRELDAYLKETGLDDYTLTDDEREVLEREPVFKEFEVGELFDCNTTKGYNPNKGDLSNGNTPYVTRSAFNNGISGYFEDESGVFMNDGNCITIGAEGGIAFYQPDDFIAGIKVYTLRHERMSCEIGMYLCGALNVHSHIYSYTNARVLDKIKAESIKLPVKEGTDDVNYTDADIDWDYITSYVRATEKQVIADVVDYKNEVIATTKKLVKN